MRRHLVQIVSAGAGHRGLAGGRCLGGFLTSRPLPPDTKATRWSRTPEDDLLKYRHLWLGLWPVHMTHPGVMPLTSPWPRTIPAPRE